MAYSFQTFSLNQVLTAAQMNQVESNVKDHSHGGAGVTSSYTSLTGSSFIAGVGSITTLTTNSFVANVGSISVLYVNSFMANVASFNTLTAQQLVASVGSINIFTGNQLVSNTASISNLTVNNLTVSSLQLYSSGLVFTSITTGSGTTPSLAGTITVPDVRAGQRYLIQAAANVVSASPTGSSYLYSYIKAYAPGNAVIFKTSAGASVPVGSSTTIFERYKEAKDTTPFGTLSELGFVATCINSAASATVEYYIVDNGLSTWTVMSGNGSMSVDRIL